MATARLDMRLSPEIKAKAEKASALLGQRSLTEYIVKLIDENSTKVIRQYESMTIENDIFDKFIQACEGLEYPNPKLVDAAAFTRKQGIK
ncbi:type II toxin-antitoxin system TacA family antitoxin [Desulfomarina sp.]